MKWNVSELPVLAAPADAGPDTDLMNGHYAARPLPCRLQGANMGSIPEGCQMVAGGRSEAAERTTTGKRVMERLHPRGMPDRPLGHTRRDRKQCPCYPCYITQDSPRASAIPPGCAAFVIRCSGGRFSQEDERPPATFCQPSGLGNRRPMPLTFMTSKQSLWDWKDAHKCSADGRTATGRHPPSPTI